MTDRLTINLVVHYRPITENYFLKLMIRFLPFPVGICCWVFFEMPKTRGFGLNTCLKSQAIFGSVRSDRKSSQMWTGNCPNFQKLQRLRS